MAHPIHSYPYNLLAELLIARRQELGLLQTEVAERLNKPQSFVSKYENVGRRLDVIEPVSYTHLDVYKRQVVSRTSNILPSVARAIGMSCA